MFLPTKTVQPSVGQIPKRHATIEVGERRMLKSRDASARNFECCFTPDATVITMLVFRLLFALG